MKIGIVGLGIIGSACKYGFEKLGHEVIVHDIKLNTQLADLTDCRIIYICVPTPSKDNGGCDTSIVESVVKELDSLFYGGIIAIKSTVTPGTTIKLGSSQTEREICFVPEFLRERCSLTDFTENHDLLAVGTHNKDVYNTIVECHGKYPKSTVMLHPTEAELLKYYSNTYNATKIIFANEMYEICKALGVNYTKIKDAFVKRGTTKDMYLDVNENFRGYAGVCLIPNTPIYTDKGLKNIQDIQIGDNVLTHNGIFKSVLNTSKRYIKENINYIKIQGITDNIGITDEHPILGSINQRKFYKTNNRLKLSSIKLKTINLNWILSKNINKGDYTCFPIPKENNQFNIFDENIARLIGYYIAEGNLEKNSYRVCFTFHAKEIPFHNDVYSIIKQYFNKKCIIKIKNNTCMIRVSSKELYELLLYYGKSYADKKEMPWNFVINSSNKIISNLFIGYFKGDGSYSGHRYTCATISKPLFEQLKYILFRLKLPFTTKIGKARIDKNNVSHKISYYITIASKEYIQILSSYLKDNIEIIKNIKNKQPIKILDNKILYTIKNIDRKFYEGDVYNLEVADDNSYVTYGFIVHNCLPKDTRALDRCAKDLGLNLKFFESLENENAKFKKTVFEGMRLE